MMSLFHKIRIWGHLKNCRSIVSQKIAWLWLQQSQWQNFLEKHQDLSKHRKARWQVRKESFTKRQRRKTKSPGGLHSELRLEWSAWNRGFRRLFVSLHRSPVGSLWIIIQWHMVILAILIFRIGYKNRPLPFRIIFTPRGPLLPTTMLSSQVDYPRHWALGKSAQDADEPEVSILNSDSETNVSSMIVGSAMLRWKFTSSMVVQWALCAACLSKREQLRGKCSGMNAKFVICLPVQSSWNHWNTTNEKPVDDWHTNCYDSDDDNILR